MSQLIKLLRLDIVFYPASGDLLGDALYEPAGTQDRSASILTEYERAVATWTFTNNKHAGASTRTLPEAQCLYLAVRAGKEVFGVIGIALEGRELEAFENSIVLSIVGECALALESDKAAREREEAAVLAKNEQLRANLLRSLGHDLRTPLTAISGSAAVLREDDGRLPAAKRRELADAIYDDSLWLIDTVENLLAITRVEDGDLHLNLTTELMDEVIAGAVAHVAREAHGHHLVVEHTDDILLARIDVHLIMQVLTNLVVNAFKYTPEGSTVTVGRAIGRGLRRRRRSPTTGRAWPTATSRTSSTASSSPIGTGRSIRTAASGWGCRSAARSSRRTGVSSRSRTTSPMGPSSSSPFPPRR